MQEYQRGLFWRENCNNNNKKNIKGTDEKMERSVFVIFVNIVYTYIHTYIHACVIMLLFYYYFINILFVLLVYFINKLYEFNNNNIKQIIILYYVINKCTNTYY